MFSLMDTDNDGKVSFEELKAGLKKVGSQLAEPEMKMLMEVVSFYCSQIQTEILLYGFIYRWTCLLLFLLKSFVSIPNPFSSYLVSKLQFCFLCYLLIISWIWIHEPFLPWLLTSNAACLPEWNLKTFDSLTLVLHVVNSFHWLSDLDRLMLMVMVYWIMESL